MDTASFLLGGASELQPSPCEQVAKQSGGGVGTTGTFSAGEAGASPMLFAPPEPFRMQKEKLMFSTLLLTAELICLSKSISAPKAFIGIFFFFFFGAL